LYSPRPKDESLLEQYNLQGKFVVGFLGTMGMAAGLEKVLVAANLLKDRSDIVLLFAGPGSQRKVLEQMVRSQGLSNVRMIAAQSKEMMPRIWSVLDVSLSVTRDDPLFLYTVSSKNYERRCRRSGACRRSSCAGDGDSPSGRFAAGLRNDGQGGAGRCAALHPREKCRTYVGRAQSIGVRATGTNRA
jgi:hypothetical protein